MKSSGERMQPSLSADDQSLLDEYLATLQVFPHNTPRLFAIGFLGLPGSGKSTVANALSDHLGLPLNRSDQIRRYLNGRGFAGAQPRPDIMAALAEGRTTCFYRNQTSAVIDANFTEYAASSRANAANYGASLLLMRVVCRDEVAVGRLQARGKGAEASGSMITTAEDYTRIKNLVATFPPVAEDMIYDTVDSTLELEPQVEAVCGRLAADGYVHS